VNALHIKDQNLLLRLEYTTNLCQTRFDILNVTVEIEVCHLGFLPSFLSAHN
jgi:hypothetical protein